MRTTGYEAGEYEMVSAELVGTGPQREFVPRDVPAGDRDSAQGRGSAPSPKSRRRINLRWVEVGREPSVLVVRPPCSRLELLPGATSRWLLGLFTWFVPIFSCHGLWTQTILQGPFQANQSVIPSKPLGAGEGGVRPQHLSLWVLLNPWARKLPLAPPRTPLDC